MPVTDEIDRSRFVESAGRTACFRTVLDHHIVLWAVGTVILGLLVRVEGHRGKGRIHTLQSTKSEW